MGQFFDKFGDNIFIKKEDENYFSVTTDIQLSPPFFAWCFQFGNKIKILSPENAIEGYMNLLNCCKNNYEN